MEKGWSVGQSWEAEDEIGLITACDIPFI